ncbi:hypothetical protein ATO3_01980 [Marinibacterium profundimaris]|uniref:YhdP central domain-containing protein n=2 Tax=Marinibacterium profundimaris TaxID=1679460 RepID=A0A225NSZ3_9RHOB|nr:hypothetical protein ATO3_01980 [Marinibacterium profundimaris]
MDDARAKAKAARAEKRAARRMRRPPRKRRHWTLRVLWRHICRLVILGALALLLAAMFKGQTLSAPAWMRDVVSATVERSLPGYRVDFADMHFVIRHGWRPRIGVEDLRVTDDAGRVLLDLSSAEASLAMRPLLRGQLNPKKITLTGARASFRRNADGGVALDLGGTGEIVEEAESLAELIESWEKRLLEPPLDALTEFELTAVTLRYDDALSGRSWTVDDGRLMMHRRGDRLSLAAALNLLSGRSYAATLEASYDSSIETREAAFGIQVNDMAAGDIALQAPALGWLEPLRAPISGALRGGTADDGTVLPLNATLRIGAGVLQPTDQTRPVPFEGARAYVSFDPADARLTFQELSFDSGWGGGTLEGQAWLSGLDQGRLEALVGQVGATDLSLNPAGVYPEPLSLDGAQADFRLSLHPFELTLGEALIRDGGNPIHLDGSVAATGAGWRFALNGRIPEIEAARLLQIWPTAALVKPRIWVEKNVRAGRLLDVDVAVRGAPGAAEPNVYADFDFAGGEVQFSPNLPPLQELAGEASFVDNRLVATATSGIVMGDAGGAMDVSGTAFIVPDVRAKPSTPAVLRIAGQGTPTAALSLLDRPPLNVLGKAGLPVDLASGHLALSGTLALPMQPEILVEDMEYHASGRVTDARSTVLVPDHELAAEDLDLFVDNDHVEISGDGQISGIPASFTWTQPLGQPGVGGRVEGRVRLSTRALETFNVTLPPGYVTGEGWGDVALDLPPKEPPRLELRTDLDGIGLSVPPLGWRLSQGATGSLEVRGRLGPRPVLDRVALSGNGLSLTGSVTTQAGGGLDRARFDRFRMGNWLDVSAELRGRGAGRAPAVVINGGSLNLASAQFGEGGGGGNVDAPPLSVSLDRLQIAKGLALTAMRGDFTTQGGLSGTFTGAMNGGTPISGRVAPQGGRSAFQIQAADAGGLFRDAGIIKQAYGGALTLTLQPAEGQGSFDGTLRVTNTNVRDGTGIGALLNSISLVGLVDELSGNGIVFSEVDARFRLTPTRLTLLSASAVGPSIGISLDGIYDLASATLDLRGVLSPLYMLNAIGSVMTRKGEGLIGVNFRLRGPASDPQVSVNPLSALAPGFLRDMFRDPAPSVGKSRTEPLPEGMTPPEPEPQQRGTRFRPRSGEDR